MRGSFRPHSLVDLLALASWSLFAAGRARLRTYRGRPLVELAAASPPRNASVGLKLEQGYDPWRVN
jgi:hypothetical protein